MLEVKDVCAGYGEIKINWSISLKIESGEIVALVGANGAGKSTLIKAIAGIIPVWSGQIIFQNRSIENLRCHKIITHGLALVPEGRRLFPYMTVAENLELGAYTEKSKEKVSENMAWVHNLFPRLKERGG
ncbi:MAG: ATP-binding cassette domain-containing protein, partial [Deltaproteobacteria bacterium]|nr:ATP-binding cassette domain-containing protein [Deltaproteobacteria bacterium]